MGTQLKGGIEEAANVWSFGGFPIEIDEIVHCLGWYYDDPRGMAFNQWGLGWLRLVWLMLVDGCAYLYEVLCDRDGITWAMDSKAQTAIANQPL